MSRWRNRVSGTEPVMLLKARLTNSRFGQAVKKVSGNLPKIPENESSRRVSEDGSCRKDLVAFMVKELAVRLREVNMSSEEKCAKVIS